LKSEIYQCRHWTHCFDGSKEIANATLQQQLSRATAALEALDAEYSGSALQEATPT